MADNVEIHDALVQPRLSDLSVRGGKLRVPIWGHQPATDSVAVIAVHGLTMSHRTWAPIAARLPGLMIVAPDLRGRGASSQLPAPYGLDQHVLDMKAILDHLGLERVIAVGHAMGGYVCEKLAASYPELV